MKSVFWFRNDLRLSDNEALTDYLNHSTRGCLVWFPTNSFLRAGTFRRAFVLESLHDLEKKLAERGTKLWLFKHPIKKCWPDLKSSLSDATWFFSKEFTKEEQDEESLLLQADCSVRSFWQSSLINPADLPFLASDTPEVFTAFRKQAEKRLQVRPLHETSKQDWPAEVELSDRILNLTCTVDEFLADGSAPKHPRFRGGVSEGLRWLEEYFSNDEWAANYKETRNGLMIWEDSTKFSPYLALGCLSPRQIYWRLQAFEAEQGANESTYWILFELLWRDYFRFLSLKWGSAFFSGMSKKWQSRVSVSDQREHFARWCSAETGQDFVDANMQELNQTGWMSNRGRQIVSSYLAKTLGVNWQWGASYFEEMLIDYDPASNWGNWAYQAGVGQDPRDRVFNPQRQADMYDPDGAYRKKWCR